MGSLQGADTGDTTQPALSAHEKEAWRSFLRFSEEVISAVERDVYAATGLSGADFQILARLHEAEEHQLTQKELGVLMGWTATRLSHQIARMDRRDLVDREAAGRGRLMMLHLTDTGWRAYTSALPVHTHSVRENYFRRRQEGS